MKKTPLLSLIALLGLILLNACGPTFKYETVPNDPMNARIYTLSNGLTVFLTVNRDAPRIQTMIPVRSGAKHDPPNNTGLSHYFEHLMFKGTKNFGTSNFEAEKVYLDAIEEMFEIFIRTTDEDERRAIYRVIDSLSFEASRFAIPNEYDRLMRAIGASGTNAFASMDITCYVEEIPSNQVENWAKIQADRFKNAVIRGFHTELETVYEEKNMWLARDGSRVMQSMLNALFPFHPYGTQTVLGSQEHLKNPSITAIKEFYRTFYVANNMAIVMSGDFDPDEVIRIIDRHFGSLPVNKNIPEVVTGEDVRLTSPVTREVLGNDPESVWIGWRVPGSRYYESDIVQLINSIMNNGKAGLIDLNVNQRQRTLAASSGHRNMVDHGMFFLTARPRQGQTLTEAKDILFEQMELLRNGEFEDWLLEASINNFRLQHAQRLESNRARAMMFVDAFAAGVEWRHFVERLDRMSRITKEEIVAFANKYFGNHNFVEVYKRVGRDPNILQIEAPEITPIMANRHKESDFLVNIRNSVVKPIEPVFLDFSRDMRVFNTVRDIPVLYKQNTDNERFELYYIFDMGTNSDRTFGLAFQYLNFLGTSRYTPEQIRKEFFKLACTFTVSTSPDRVHVGITGLSKNMERAIQLLEELLSDPQVNEAAFRNMIADVERTRIDNKKEQR